MSGEQALPQRHAAWPHMRPASRALQTREYCLAEVEWLGCLHGGGQRSAISVSTGVGSPHTQLGSRVSQTRE